MVQSSHPCWLKCHLWLWSQEVRLLYLLPGSLVLPGAARFHLLLRFLEPQREHTNIFLSSKNATLVNAVSILLALGNVWSDRGSLHARDNSVSSSSEILNNPNESLCLSDGPFLPLLVPLPLTFPSRLLYQLWWAWGCAGRMPVPAPRSVKYNTHGACKNVCWNTQEPGILPKGSAPLSAGTYSFTGLCQTVDVCFACPGSKNLC